MAWNPILFNGRIKYADMELAVKYPIFTNVTLCSQVYVKKSAYESESKKKKYKSEHVNAR